MSTLREMLAQALGEQHGIITKKTPWEDLPLGVQDMYLAKQQWIVEVVSAWIEERGPAVAGTLALALADEALDRPVRMCPDQFEDSNGRVIACSKGLHEWSYYNRHEFSRVLETASKE